MVHPPAPGPPLSVELCYPEPPGIDVCALVRQVQTSEPGTRPVWLGPTSVLLRHDRPDPVRDRPDPTDILGLPPEGSRLTEPPSGAGHLLTALQLAPHPDRSAVPRDLSQCWQWPDADATLGRCRYTVSIVQLIGQQRPVPDRLRAFRAALDAAITLARPLATWWPASQQALPPGVLVSHQLIGVVNVRTFRAVDNPHVTVTDTLGLHTIGLPDVQCRSRNLDLDRLGGVLLHLAEYLYEAGDRIPAGPLIGVPGIAEQLPDQRFTVARGVATVPPVRPVLDLDPGPPYGVPDR